MKQLFRKKYFGDTLEEVAFFSLTLFFLSIWLLFSIFCCVAVNYTSSALQWIYKGGAFCMCLAWCYASTLLGGVFVLFCRNAIRRLGLWKSLPPLGLVVLAIGYGIFTGFQYELYWQWWIVLAALLAFAYLLRSFTFLAGSLCWLGGIHIVRTLLACLRETLLFFAPMERGAMLKFGIVFRTMAVGTKRMAEGKGTPGRRRRHTGVAWRGSDAPLKYKNGTCTVKEYFCQEKKQETENEEANDCRPEYESGSRERSVNGVQIWSVGPDGKDDDAPPPVTIPTENSIHHSSRKSRKFKRMTFDSPFPYGKQRPMETELMNFGFSARKGMNSKYGNDTAIRKRLSHALRDLRKCLGHSYDARIWIAGHCVDVG